MRRGHKGRLTLPAGIEDTHHRSAGNTNPNQAEMSSHVLR